MASYKGKQYPEIRVTGVSSKLNEELQNIAGNIGITKNSFLKMKLREISNSYPEKMKLPGYKD